MGGALSFRSKAILVILILKLNGRDTIEEMAIAYYIVYN